MKNMFNFIKNHKKNLYYVIGVLILIAGAMFFFSNQKTSDETITIKRSLFVNQVSVSGKVETESGAQLGFAASGRIDRIFVKNNDSVKAGQILAQLEITDLLADLKIKEIGSKTSNISLEDARQNVEKVTAQENTKVESAYRALLTEDLELVPDSNNYVATPPNISGIYDGGEGTYKINIEKENVTIDDFTLRTFNLEKTDRLINEKGPTLLGTKGLYIDFEDDLEEYHDTTWYLDIPNKSGASYLANYNAYNEAKNERNLAIKNAEFEYQKLLTEKNNGSDSVPDAEIEKKRAEIKKNTIYAPFDGIVTNIEKEIGEIASTNEPLITIMSSGAFEIESFVPEVNIALIKLYDEARVTLDAYGEDVLFNAKVISIDPAETIKDGISTYKIKLQFNQEDSRIKSGMTANVSIIIFEKPDVIVVPGGVIFLQDGKNFVQVKNDKLITNREVILGDVSSLGQVEIVSVLEEGDKVVLNPLVSLAE